MCIISGSGALVRRSQCIYRMRVCVCVTVRMCIDFLDPSLSSEDFGVYIERECVCVCVERVCVCVCVCMCVECLNLGLCSEDHGKYRGNERETERECVCVCKFFGSRALFRISSANFQNV